MTLPPPALVSLADLPPSARLARFAKLLRHQKGPKAGQPFSLDEWQIERIISPILDRVDETGHRLVDEVFVFIPRKNAKTTLIAILALYFLFIDQSDPQPEIYVCASDIEQANILFGIAAGMVRSCPPLMARSRVYKREIRTPRNNGLFKVIPSDSAGALGLNPSVAIIDEVVAIKNDDLMFALKTGMGARDYPLTISLSTAGEFEESLVGDMLARSRRILSGELHAPRFLPILFEGDRNLPWDSEENWAIANPGLGKTISIDRLRSEAAEAQYSASARAKFKIFHLNWFDSSATTGFIDLNDWGACQDLEARPDLSSPLYLALDLARVSDLCSGVAVWCQDGKYLIRHHSWLPEGALDRAETIPPDQYRKWQDQGILTILPGKSMVWEPIIDWIREMSQLGSLKEIIYDPAHSADLINTVERDQEFPGVELVKFLQTPKFMGPAVNSLERAVLNREIVQTGDGLLRHALEKVIMVLNPFTNLRQPSKTRSSAARIDPLVALIMGHERARQNQFTTSAAEFQISIA